MPSLEDLEKEKLIAEIERIRQETENLKLSKEIPPQNNAELERKKLEAEIDKITQETAQIKKPWFVQTSFLNLLVSILIPILTIVLAYFFGGGKEYFDAQKLKLETDKELLTMDKSKLTDSIKIFNSRKDSLNKKNIQLANTNTTLNSDKIKLEQDTLNLNTDLRKSKIEKKRLAGNVIDLRFDKRNLEKQKNVLVQNIETLPFTITWGRFISPNYFDFDQLFSDLVDTIKHSTIHKTEYLNIVKSYADSVKDLNLKGSSCLLLYAITGESIWRDKFLNVGDNIPEDVKSKPNLQASQYFRYWVTYPRLYYYNAIFYNNNSAKNKKVPLQERLIYVKRLIRIAKRISNHPVELDLICSQLSRLSNVYPTDNDDIIVDYLRSPDVFCFLAKESNNLITGVPPYLSYPGGAIYLFSKIAPIASVCLMANYLNKAIISDISSREQLDGFTSQILSIIERNKEILTPLSAAPTVEEWNMWQKKNTKIIEVFNGITQNCSQQNIQKLIGN